MQPLQLYSPCDDDANNWQKFIFWNEKLMTITHYFGMTADDHYYGNSKESSFGQGGANLYMKIFYT